MTYSHSTLKELAVSIFEKVGYNKLQASFIADVIVAAELRGHSTHGMIRIKDYLHLWKSNRLNIKPDVKVVYETPGTAVIDGDSSIGMLPARFSMELAIEKARNVGTGWVSTRNSCNFGIAGFYSMMALEHDMIGIAMTNASPLVAPTFSADAMLGTNPISVAIPANTQPAYVADFATTPINRGKFTIAVKKGEKLGFGFAQDKDGNASDDPTILEKGGAMVPLGGDYEHGSHKGYCLGSIVDILTSVLSGANFGPFVPPMVSYLPLLDKKVGEGLGHFFGAIRVDAFQPANEFKDMMDIWIETFRKAKPTPGHSRVMIPGDPEREKEEKYKQEGITLMPVVINDLKEIVNEFKIDFKF
jgi:LDH2 family malate/lactate/ureidoglycolate dehydrogenase